MKPALTLYIASWIGKKMSGKKWETGRSIFCRPSFCRFFLCALLLAAVPCAHAGLVAHFRFDGDLKDATGRHDGRPVDPTLAPVFAPGRVGGAVVIERTNAYGVVIDGQPGPRFFNYQVQHDQSDPDQRGAGTAAG